MKAINSLWYKLSKSAVGPIFNVSSSLLEAILGTPPLEIQNRIITVKHYLKCVTDQHDNHQGKHLSFILDELAARNSAVESHIRKVFKFLEWKIKIRPEVFSGDDQYIVEKNMFDQFPSLSILLTKTTAAKNEVALSYHSVRGQCFLAVVFVAAIRRHVFTQKNL